MKWRGSFLLLSFAFGGARTQTTHAHLDVESGGVVGDRHGALEGWVRPRREGALTFAQRSSLLQQLEDKKVQKGLFDPLPPPSWQAP